MHPFWILRKIEELWGKAVGVEIASDLGLW
jgi:hypothetical protein